MKRTLTIHDKTLKSSFETAVIHPNFQSITVADTVHAVNYSDTLVIVTSKGT